MTLKEASEIIGCSPRHAAHLVSKGILRATRKPSTTNRHGYEYEVSLSEAERVRDHRPSVGYPLGKKRK